MKKKIISLCLVIALLATAITGATLAYFTDTDDAENVFTIGNVDIELNEPAWTEEGGGEAQGVDAYPGEALPKDPTVTNIGSNPCFVRVKVTGLDQFVDTYGEGAMITYETGYVEGALGEGWVLHTDGYFYYNEPLCVDGTEDESWNVGLDDVTTALFDQIRIPTQLKNGEETDPVDVVAEAVQAQGARASWNKEDAGDGVYGVRQMTVADIAAWFDTCGMND